MIGTKRGKEKDKLREKEGRKEEKMRRQLARTQRVGGGRKDSRRI